MNIDADGTVGDVPEMKAKTTYRTPEDGTYIVSGKLVEAKTGEVLWEEPQAAYSVSKEKPGQAEKCVSWPSEEVFMRWWQTAADKSDGAHGEELHEPGPQRIYRWLRANTKLRSVDEVQDELLIEIERLRAEQIVVKWKDDGSISSVERLLGARKSSIKELEAKVEVLREALELIAKAHEVTYAACMKANVAKLAREALKKIGDEK